MSGSDETKRALSRSRVMDEKAFTKSLGARTSSEWVVMPVVLAAASVALTSSTLPAFAGLNRIAMRVASGAISLRISSRLPATSGIMLLTPVMFPRAVRGLRQVQLQQDRQPPP